MLRTWKNTLINSDHLNKSDFRAIDFSESDQETGIDKKFSVSDFGHKAGLIAEFDSLTMIRAVWSTALPIPLCISNPHGTFLVAWAVRLCQNGADPQCFLAIAGQESLVRSSDWIVTTHFGPVGIVAQPADRDRVIPSEEAPFMVRALLQAVAPDTVAAISKALVAIPGALTALNVREPGVLARHMIDDRLRIEGRLDFLPGHAVIRSGRDLHIVPVRTVDFVFEAREFAEIGLDVTGVAAIDEVMVLLGDRRLVSVHEAPADVR